MGARNTRNYIPRLASRRYICRYRLAQFLEAANLELLRRQLLHPLLLRLNNFINHAVSP